MSEYNYCFSVILCDRWCSNFIKNCDLGIEEYGVSATISFVTNLKPNKQNIKRIIKLLESTKDNKELKQYYSMVKFERAEVILKGVE